MAAPLADKIRPKTLDDVVGQKHILGEGKPLRRIIESGKISNMIFYGPSGVGKTTVARIIADNCNMSLYKLNGTNSSLSDIKDVVADIGTFGSENGILLYLDEIQYLNKKQQQSLLEYIENGDITLIASTTENPYFAVYNAVISRSTVFEFKPVPADELIPAVQRAFSILSQENNCVIEAGDDVLRQIVYNCGGFETVETVRMLEGFVDIWLPDFKYYDDSLALELSAAPHYKETAADAIREMIRQTGTPCFYDDPALHASQSEGCGKAGPNPRSAAPPPSGSRT